jgi:hypothetical protein
MGSTFAKPPTTPEERLALTRRQLVRATWECNAPALEKTKHRLCRCGHCPQRKGGPRPKSVRQLDCPRTTCLPTPRRRQWLSLVHRRAKAGMWSAAIPSSRLLTPLRQVTRRARCVAARGSERQWVHHLNRVWRRVVPGTAACSPASTLPSRSLAREHLLRHHHLVNRYSCMLPRVNASKSLTRSRTLAPSPPSCQQTNLRVSIAHSTSLTQLPGTRTLPGGSGGHCSTLCAFATPTTALAGSSSIAS